MGMYVTTTAIPILLPFFLKGNDVTSDTAGVAIFDRQIDNAESIVNAGISSRYGITAFTAIPPLLRQLTEKIAIYNVIIVTGFAADKRNEYTDDYKFSLETLKSIEEGNKNLTYTDGSVVAVEASSRFVSDKSSYTPIFGLDNQTQWKRDTDEVSDQEKKRT